MNRYRIFYLQTSTLPPRMHHKLTKHGRFCKQNNHLPTKTHVELKDNSIMSLRIESGDQCECSNPMPWYCTCVQASRQVLDNYGNMSSACVLFVLDQLRKNSIDAGATTTGEGNDFGLLIGIGPGLTVETLLLRSIPLRPPSPLLNGQRQLTQDA
jgi:hypothetical protein